MIAGYRTDMAYKYTKGRIKGATWVNDNGKIIKGLSNADVEKKLNEMSSFILISKESGNGNKDDPFYISLREAIDIAKDWSENSDSQNDQITIYRNGVKLGKVYGEGWHPTNDRTIF